MFRGSDVRLRVPSWAAVLAKNILGEVHHVEGGVAAIKSLNSND